MRKLFNELGLIGVGVAVLVCLSWGSHDAEAKPPSFIEAGKIHEIDYGTHTIVSKILEVDDCWATARVTEAEGMMRNMKAFRGATIRINLCSAWRIEGPKEDGRE